MSILKFYEKLDEVVKVGLVNKDELKQALCTALLEVDRNIRDSVIRKIWKEDFNFVIGLETAEKEA